MSFPDKMADNKSKKAVVVLGPGRSGTSLLTKILIDLGMTTSTADLIQGDNQNPDGYFEDLELVDIHKSIFHELQCHEMAPIPEEKIKSESALQFIPRLKEVVETRLSNSHGDLWGFKDPRINTLLPLWDAVFESAQIEAKYILCLRDPSDVVVSMNNQNDNGKNFAELVWLTRICDALHYAKSEVFILHYEDWFDKKAPEVARKLTKFLGLEPADYIKTIERNVKVELNRSRRESYSCNNLEVENLYQLLRVESGFIEINRREIFESVERIRYMTNQYAGWSEFAIQNYWHFMNQKAKNQSRAKKLVRKQHKKLVSHVLKLDSERAELVARNKALESKNEYLKEADASDLRTQLIDLEKQNFELCNTVYYQLGRILVLAIVKPGKNTVMFPLYIMRLILEKTLMKKWL